MRPNLSFSFNVSMSDGLQDLCSGERLWNIYGRAAMAGELEKHHRERIPKHFRLGARSTYNYARRRQSTERKKVKYWRVPANLDLVRTGRSSQSVMRKYSITFGGSFGAGVGGGPLQGRLNMWLPYPLRRNEKVGGISPEQIANEITSVTEGEGYAIANGFRDRVVQQINAYHGPMRKRRPKGGWRGILANPPW